MAAVLIFLVLPAFLIWLSFRIKPVAEPDGDPFGATLAARGLYGRQAEPDPAPVVPEETEAVKFKLG